MNKKTIVNRTLPLIIALLVVIVVAICVTAFSGSKVTPMVDNKSDAYLTVDLGYEKPIIIDKEELYGKLKNGNNGLSFLVDILDSKLLSEKGYMQKVTEEKIKAAIEEAIFGKDYEFDPENLDADNQKIETYVKNMLNFECMSVFYRFSKCKFVCIFQIISKTYTPCYCTYLYIQFR